MAATPFTNSTSPTAFIGSGPSLRNIAPHSTNTVPTTLWPSLQSARRSGSR